MMVPSNMPRPGLKPGETAPVSGHYAEMNVFGTKTGVQVFVHAGDRLPDSLVWYSWQLVSTIDQEQSAVRR
jgi:hypothetical protein